MQKSSRLDAVPKNGIYCEVKIYNVFFQYTKPEDYKHFLIINEESFDTLLELTRPNNKMQGMLFGLVVVVVSAVVLANLSHFDEVINDDIRIVAISSLVLGVIILIVALFGLYSVVKKSPRLLKIYGGMVLVIFVAEIALAIAFFACKPFLLEKMSERMQQMIKSNDEKSLRAIDAIQKDFQCCGVESPADWIDQSPTQTLRSSCCMPEYIDEGTNDCKNAQPLFKDRYYQVGCLAKLKENFAANTDLLTFLLLGFAILQILFIIAIFLLASYYERKSVSN